METRDGGGVPGIAGQGAREKTAFVVDKMGDGHVDDLLGKPGDKVLRDGRAVVETLSETLRNLDRVRYQIHLTNISLDVAVIVVK